MILQQFIEAGWYTVPLAGKLERLPDGSKTKPQFEKGWRQKYSAERNLKPSLLAMALTGSQSGIIALDCDTAQTYDLFTSLDKENNFKFSSIGKPVGGGTIVYEYENIRSFSIADSEFKLDFRGDNRDIYLPTEHNFTKEAWRFKRLPKLKKLPESIRIILNTLANKLQSPVELNRPAIATRLEPMVAEFVATGRYSPKLFRIITPKDFRVNPKYNSQRHLHPKDIPDGQGSIYLSQVSAILGADISINIELYRKAMYCINDLWESPLDTARLETTIINPMITGSASVNGKSIWQYDPEWKKSGFLVTARNGDYFESFIDYLTGEYFLVNYTAECVHQFSDKNRAIGRLKSLLGTRLSELQYDSAISLNVTVFEPHLEFGYTGEAAKPPAPPGAVIFNLFRRSPELEIVNNPEVHRADYKYPKTTLMYFESLIPDEFMRNFVLRFIRTKLTTFDYSPIVLYFIGTQGSGKDTFVKLLGSIIGDKYIAKPSPQVFTEKTNGWVQGIFFAQLNEYGDTVNQYQKKEEVLGLIKNYSGSPNVEIREMRRDLFHYVHNMTLILTANKSPLPVELTDRRIAYVHTPHNLAKEPWVHDAGGITKVIARIVAHEVKDFCYYLATAVTNLTPDEYVIAPETADKETLIVMGMPITKRIVHYIDKRRFDMLQDMAEAAGVDRFTEHWQVGRMPFESLCKLYKALAGEKAEPKYMRSALNKSGYKCVQTTTKGMHWSYYDIPELTDYMDSPIALFKVEESYTAV